MLSSSRNGSILKPVQVNDDCHRQQYPNCKQKYLHQLQELGRRNRSGRYRLRPRREQSGGRASSTLLAASANNLLGTFGKKNAVKRIVRNLPESIPRSPSPTIILAPLMLWLSLFVLL